MEIVVNISFAFASVKPPAKMFANATSVKSLVVSFILVFILYKSNFAAPNSMIGRGYNYFN